MSTPANIDEYIAGFPEDVQKALEGIRATIHKTIPEAGEKISYGMPTFTFKGKYLVYFAAHKKHIGFYPVPDGNEAFEKDFAAYKTSGKGTIQFPLNRPMPLQLITKIVAFRVRERMEEAEK